jgi:dephospho-CoA kinase
MTCSTGTSCDPQSRQVLSIGVTGGIGCGKTTVADMFAARGASIIDTDQIAHALTAPGGIALPAIEAQFGSAFILPSGAMDRARMRAHVFSDPNAKQQLEAILHPLIRTETEHAAQLSGGRYVMFVVPLLIESGTWQSRLSRILVIDCPEELQIARVMQRNALSEAEVRAIMNTQVSREVRLAAADDIIVNDAGIAALTPQVERLHAQYCALADAMTSNRPQNL